jgi:hypothetical protein
VTFVSTRPTNRRSSGACTTTKASRLSKIGWCLSSVHISKQPMQMSGNNMVSLLCHRPRRVCLQILILPLWSTYLVNSVLLVTSRCSTSVSRGAELNGSIPMTEPIKRVARQHLPGVSRCLLMVNCSEKAGEAPKRLPGMKLPNKV